MPMIRTIIVDDEAHCRQALVKALDSLTRKVEVLAACSSADEAKAAIAHHKPDLVFLDVEMPVNTGFDLLSELEHDITFDIIFVTAYEQYAIRAIRSSAFDFLLKPVGPNELRESLHRFESKQNNEHRLKQVANLLQNYGNAKATVETIVVPTNSSLEFIRTKHILRLEAQSSYATFFMTDGS